MEKTSDKYETWKIIQEREDKIIKLHVDEFFDNFPDIASLCHKHHTVDYLMVDMGLPVKVNIKMTFDYLLPFEIAEIGRHLSHYDSDVDVRMFGCDQGLILEIDVEVEKLEKLNE